MTAKPTAARIEDALQDADFPMDKDHVVAHVEHHTTDDAVRQAVRSLPLGDYESRAEVVRSVDTVEATGQSRSEKAAQARRHQHAGLAEHQRSPRT